MSARVTLQRVTLIARLPSRFTVGGMHPPPASYDRHGSCHFNRSPAVLEWCFVTLRPSSVVVAGSVGTGFRPSWFHLGRRRRHYHDDDVLSLLSPTSSRDTSLPGGGESQSLVRLPAENDVVPSVGFPPDRDRVVPVKIQNNSTVRN